jgi:hypothetical protein
VRFVPGGHGSWFADVEREVFQFHCDLSLPP